MTKINVYLTFDDNCEKAFNFYQSIFGGEFVAKSRFSEMPPGPDYHIPDDEKEKLMHITLPISKETVLMGSDKLHGFGPELTVGNNFSISVNTDSLKESERVFKQLSEGGQIIMPMEKTFWGSYFGMLTDKFGINWMVSFSENETTQ